MKYVLAVLIMYTINALCGLGSLLALKLYKVKIKDFNIGFPKIKHTKIGLLPIGNKISIDPEAVIDHPKQTQILLVKQIIPFIICFGALILSFVAKPLNYIFWPACLSLIIRLIPYNNSEIMGLLYIFERMSKNEKIISNSVLEAVEQLSQEEKNKPSYEKKADMTLPLYRAFVERKIKKKYKKEGNKFYASAIGQNINSQYEDDINEEMNKIRDNLIEKYKNREETNKKLFEKIEETHNPDNNSDQQ